jgi:HSP20 family protein
MAESATKLPVRTTEGTTPAKAPATSSPWYMLDDLRHEVDRLFQDFGRRDWLRPFRGSDLEPTFHRYFTWNAPAVDIVEKEAAFEITAELPGIASKDVDVSVKNGTLIIKGEKQEHKEERDKDYYLKERQYGSFERSFAVPEGVDKSAIEATFNNGVLKVTLPKTLDAQKPAKKIDVKAA